VQDQDYTSEPTTPFDTPENIESFLKIFDVEGLVNNIRQIQAQTIVRESILELMLDFFWASFEIAAIFDIPFESDQQETEESIQKGKHKKRSRKAKRISVAHGLSIVDLGNRLITSTSEYYGSLSKSRLLRTADVMVEIMAKRGFKRVHLDGSSNSAAIRASIACKRYGIQDDYSPSPRYQTVIQRVEQIRIK
jgi:hypothetical protein